MVLARKTTRKTRSTRTKNGSESSFSALDTAQKIKKRPGNAFQPLEKKLAQSEVDHDLRELGALYETSKKNRIETSGMDSCSLASSMEAHASTVVAC